MLAALLLTAYLGLWPVPIHAVSWEAPPAPGHTGAYATNRKLSEHRIIPLGGEVGPEHVVVGSDGKLYTAVASGRILRMNPDGSEQEVFAATGGRPLGLAFDPRNNLIVADANRGILSISADRKVTLLTNTAEREPIRFANAVAVARNGRVYFSDSSARFAPTQWGGTMAAAMLDVIEQSCTGRVLEYDPRTTATRIVAHRLCFANGVVLSSDEKSLYVAETGRYRVWKIDVTADKLDITNGPPGTHVALDNLPGYPDNLMRGQDDKIWLGLAGQRNDLDALAGRPFMRELALRIPRILWPMPKPYGHVLAFLEDGKIVDDLQDPAGASPTTTGATETTDRLYIHNVDGTGLGWIARPAVPIGTLPLRAPLL